jgi:hypothetical protein
VTAPTNGGTSTGGGSTESVELFVPQEGAQSSDSDVHGLLRSSGWSLSGVGGSSSMPQEGSQSDSGGA